MQHSSPAESTRRPFTIYGFPKDLHEVQYPAPGDPELAARIRDLIGSDAAQLSDEWGLDHGAWSVLRWMYAAAHVPVVQPSVNRRLSASARCEPCCIDQ